MTGSTVNIADFRCRAIKARASHLPLRSVNRSSGPMAVASKPESVVLKLELQDVSAASGNKAVCDIGAAREAQGLRRRIAIRPISIQRRNNVVRFGESKVRVIRAEELGRRPRWPAASEDSYDLPPAA